MYTKMENSGVEDVCYEEEHIRKVLQVISSNFEKYFKDFIESNAMNGLSAADFQKLQVKFGLKPEKHKKAKDLSRNYKDIIIEAIERFEKDRADYERIFDEELLEDYEDDADAFKSKVLRNECPIIRKTLANRRAKELDKYRAAFSSADADWLLQVVTNLCVFGNEYVEEYDSETYENMKSFKEMGMELLDTDDYTAYGVIGGGIKTHMLYKVHPAQFPNRSRSAIWALWYLTDKQTFGCKTDSEFLMIDVKKSITQQNYFYPYQLFAFYAFEIYKMLKEKASEYDVYIDPDYRYVIVDAFLEYIAEVHDNEIAFLKEQIRDGGMGYA